MLLSSLIFAQNKLNVIPYPQNVQLNNGNFSIPDVLILSDDLPENETEYFKKRLNSEIRFKISKKAEAQLIYSQLPNAPAGKEEFYILEVSPKQIHIQSYTKQGYFLALQTVSQLFENYKTEKKIPALKIEDQPKFAWRGMHLDVCRHFFTVAEVKQYIDYLAMYKLNTFHWHLTDDQGWRIEIKNILNSHK